MTKSLIVLISLALASCQSEGIFSSDDRKTETLTQGFGQPNAESVDVEVSPQNTPPNSADAEAANNVEIQLPPPENTGDDQPQDPAQVANVDPTTENEVDPPPADDPSAELDIEVIEEQVEAELSLVIDDLDWQAFYNQTERDINWTASGEGLELISGYSLFVYGQADCLGEPIDNVKMENPGSPFILQNGQTYSFRVTAEDASGAILVESLCSTAFYVDTLIPPPPGQPALNAETSKLSESPIISWQPSQEAGSGVVSYQAALGTSALSYDVIDWTDVGLVDNFQFLNLNLTEGQSYYVSLRSVDGGGLYSNSVDAGSFLATAQEYVQGLIKVARGDSFACGLTAEKDVVCWGSPSYGALGTPSNVPYNGAVMQTSIGEKVNKVVAAYNTACVLTESSRVKCWGLNSFGIMGTSLNTEYPSAQTVAFANQGPNRPVDIYMGKSHLCALTESGLLTCLGAGNSYGAIAAKKGPSDIVYTPTASSVNVPGNIEKVALGFQFNCIIDSNAKVLCWGRNEFGQLGKGPAYPKTSYFATSGGYVNLPGPAEEIYAGKYSACARVAGNSLYCWGRNVAGGLPNIAPKPATLGYNTPQNTGVLSNSIQSFAMGADSSCLVSNNGVTQCIGSNLMGALGNGTTVDSATFVTVQGAQTGISKISAGPYGFCSLSGTGVVRCWGSFSSTLLPGQTLYYNPNNLPLAGASLILKAP